MRIYIKIFHAQRKRENRWRFRTQMNKIKVNGARGGVWLGLGQNSARRRDALWNGVAHWGNQHAMKTQGDEKERETDGRKRLIVRTRSGIKSTIIIQPEPNYRLHCSVITLENRKCATGCSTNFQTLLQEIAGNKMPIERPGNS